MEHNDNHWHWWHWVLLVIVILIGLGIAYTWISNVTNHKNQSYLNGVQQTIEHPIHKTENAVTDITQ